MPRPRKGARLYLRPARRNSAGAIIEGARWIIRDGARSFGTGCGAGESEEAERRLAEYITSKHEPARRVRPLSETKIADVISIYLDDVVPGQARPAQAAGRAERLIEFFGNHTLDEITGKLCRDYEEWRRGRRSGINETGKAGTGGGARRDLQDLQAAINHHHREGLHREDIKIVLPPRGMARQRWMTRGEVARLLWICWRTKETQRGRETHKHPLRHLCRFMVLGIYTGSRPGAVLNASWFPGPSLSYVDTEQGVFHRHPDGAIENNKRQPTVRIAPRLLAHLKRWERMDAAKEPRPVFVVTFQGQRVGDVGTALERACNLAGLSERVIAYTLRHTCGSWLVAQGIPTRKVSDFLGTSEAMVIAHYGHLAPDYQEEAADAIGRK